MRGKIALCALATAALAVPASGGVVIQETIHDEQPRSSTGTSAALRVGT